MKTTMAVNGVEDEDDEDDGEDDGYNSTGTTTGGLGGTLVGGIVAFVTGLVGFAVVASVVSGSPALNAMVVNGTSTYGSALEGSAFQIVLQNLPVLMGISLLAFAGAWAFMGTGSMSSSDDEEPEDKTEEPETEEAPPRAPQRKGFSILKGDERR
jgi:hypothetical protein